MPTPSLDSLPPETKIKFRVGPGWAAGTVVRRIPPDAYRDGVVRYELEGVNGGRCIRTIRSMRLVA